MAEPSEPDPVATPQSSSSGRARSATSTNKRQPEASIPSPESRGRKSRKVSRACDYCKVKKLKCSGIVPCNICTKRDLPCHYESAYRRGRPPTPPAAPELDSTIGPIHLRNPNPVSRPATHGPPEVSVDGGYPARHGNPAADYPELESTEIGGQIVDSTSNLNFMHSAWRRLALQNRNALPDSYAAPARLQPLTCAGDHVFAAEVDDECVFLNSDFATLCFDFYFANCVVTYRLLHQPTCQEWLQSMVNCSQNGLPCHQDVGCAKAAAVCCMIAIAGLRQHNLSTQTSSPSSNIGQSSVDLSERYFLHAMKLSQMETGYPQLESVQSRVLQLLYLLQTSRMNQAWYVFAGIIPMLFAIGMHRKTTPQANTQRRQQMPDYIISECRKRTFWVVYTIDTYISVVFGRPKFLHDEDINQDQPDSINDEDMTAEGAETSEPWMDCHVESLKFHARIARIIGSVSRDVYTLKASMEENRLATTAERYANMLREWHEALPPHLGAVRPLSLVPSFRRQCIALKLAYAHALIHVNRPFLLCLGANAGLKAVQNRVADCLNGARMVLDLADEMIMDRRLFYALWWTPYVTFCALAVVYVWEIQRNTGKRLRCQEDPVLLSLAERCQAHLSKSSYTNSMGRRYGVMIEELRLEATQHQSRDSPRQILDTGGQHQPEPGLQDQPSTYGMGEPMDTMPPSRIGDKFSIPFDPLTQWEPTDWLNFDSSVLSYF